MGEERGFMGTGYRKNDSVRGGLRFGTRVMEEVASTTLLSEALYESLPNRRDCVICGGPLIKNVHYPCCTKECKRRYKEWLNEKK